jgi:hypothetical protein
MAQSRIPISNIPARDFDFIVRIERPRLGESDDKTVARESESKASLI